MTPLSYPPQAGASMVSYIYGSKVSVYSGVAPVAWTDLDLSGTVGARRTNVKLLVNNGSGDATALNVYVRQNGATVEEQGGVGYITLLGDGYRGAVWCLTDNSGIIEHKFSAAKNVTIYLTDWIVS